MILYVVSIKIQQSVHDDWMKYMQQVHIPDVMKTGCFTNCVLSRVLEPASEQGWTAYSIQYACDSLENYQRYRQEFAVGLQEEHTRRYAGKFRAEREVR